MTIEERAETMHTTSTLPRRLKGIAVAFGIAIAFGPVAAPAQVIVFDPTTYAQSVATQANTLATQISAAQQVKNQLDQLVLQQKQLKLLDPTQSGLTPGQWSDAKQNLLALAKIVQQNKNLSFNDENLATVFKQAYPDFKSPVDFSKLTQTWYDNTKGAMLNALQVAGLATKQFAQDDVLLNQAMTDTDNSATQAHLTQVGNRVAAMTVQQLQKLQQMEAARQNYETAYYAQQAGSAKVSSSAISAWLGGSTH